MDVWRRWIKYLIYRDNKLSGKSGWFKVLLLTQWCPLVIGHTSLWQSAALRNQARKQPVTSAFINVEAWRKNENTTSFDRLVKGALLTVEGYFKPEEWQDADGVKHNRVHLCLQSFMELLKRRKLLQLRRRTPSKAFLLSNRAAFGSLFYAYTSLCWDSFLIHRLRGIGINSVAKVNV